MKRPIINDCVSTVKRVLRKYGGLFLGLLLFGLGIMPAKVEAQEEIPSRVDSLAKEEELNKLLYSIKLLRLHDALAQISAENNPDSDLLQLKADAEKYAQEGEYLVANILLNGALQLVEEGNSKVQEPLLLAEPIENQQTTSLTLKKELGVGIEFSRQEFGLALGEQDSSFLETRNNPYSSLRLGLDYGSAFYLENYFKYSRDYISDELLFVFLHGMTTAKQIQLENRLQGTAYKRDNPMKYLQENLIITANYAPSRGLMIYTQNEFSARRYGEESEAYPNYFHEYLKIRMDYLLALGSKIGFGYRFQWQGYPSFREYDYTDHVFEFTFSKTSVPGASFFVENQFLVRDYYQVVEDSSFWGDYTEERLNLEVWRGFGTGLVGRIENEFIYRRNRNVKASTPDFIYGEIKPSVAINFIDQWTLSLAPVFSFQNHFSRNTDLTSLVAKENYYAPGLSVSIDFLNPTGLTFSLNNTYEWRRFPKTKAIRDFSLYSDRNVNSLLFFLSWKVMDGLELVLIANYDDDRDKKNENANSRSTIFSLELTKSW